MAKQFLMFGIFLSLFVTPFAQDKNKEKLYNDLTSAGGRTTEDCKRLFIEDEDLLSRNYVQRKLPGGKTARIGDPCNHKEWLDIRKEFIAALWEGNQPRYVTDYYVGYQTNKSLDVRLHPKINKIYLERWCISCAGEPILECAPNNTCICYRKYKVEAADDHLLIEGKRQIGELECKIKVGDPCEIFSEIDCETDSYCDNDTLKCKRRFIEGETENQENKPYLEISLLLLQIMSIIFLQLEHI